MTTSDYALDPQYYKEGSYTARQEENLPFDELISCKSSIVESTVTRDGIESTLYCRVRSSKFLIALLPPRFSTPSLEGLCTDASDDVLRGEKVALPRATSRTTGLLLSLLPTTTFKTGRVFQTTSNYGIDRSLEGDEKRIWAKAANLLKIPGPGKSGEGAVNHETRELSHRETDPGRKNAAATEGDGARASKWKIVQRENGLYLADGVDEAEEQIETRTEAYESPDEPGSALELITVLDIETRFGVFQEPKFANIITLPVPRCACSSLRLTLPPPPSPSAAATGPGAWDLKVHPSLSEVHSVSSCGNQDSSTGPSTLIVGSFPSASTVSIRWTRQIEPTVRPPSIEVTSSRLAAVWRLGEQHGGGKGKGKANEVETGKTLVDLEVQGEWEYCGLRDKHWVSISVPKGAMQKGESDGEAAGFEVLEVRGDAIVGWEVDRHTERLDQNDDSTSTLNGSMLKTLLSNPLELSQPSDSAQTNVGTSTTTSVQPAPPPLPTARRRYSSSSLRPSLSSRSRLTPRWTSLFETVGPSAPPVPPLLDLDSSSLSFSSITSSLPTFAHSINRSKPFVQSEEERDISTNNSDEILTLLSQEQAPFDSEVSNTGLLDMSFEQDHLDQAVDLKGQEVGAVEMLLNERLEHSQQEDDEDDEVQAIDELPPVAKGTGQIQLEDGIGHEETQTSPIPAHLPIELSNPVHKITATPISPSTSIIRIQLSHSLLVSSYFSSCGKNTSSLDKSSLPKFSLRIKLAFWNDSLLPSTVSSLSGSDFKVTERVLETLSLPVFSLLESRFEHRITTASMLSANEQPDDEVRDRGFATQTMARLQSPFPPTVSIQQLQTDDASTSWSSTRRRAKTLALKQDSRASSEADDEENDERSVLVQIVETKFPNTGDQHWRYGSEGFPDEERLSESQDRGLIQRGRQIEADQPTQDPVFTSRRTSPASTPSSASNVLLPVIPTLSIEITPISPTLTMTNPSPSDWRIFYRLRFENSSVQTFTIPTSDDSQITVHHAWDQYGRTLAYDCSGTGDGGIAQESCFENGIRVSTLASGDQVSIREILYEERKAGEDIEGAALLPVIDQTVAQYTVDVFEAQGYDLNVVFHEFDLSTSKEKDSRVRRFTKFLVLSHSRPFLPLRFRPTTTSSTSRMSHHSKRKPPSHPKTALHPGPSSFRESLNLLSLIALALLSLGVGLSHLYPTNVTGATGGQLRPTSSAPSFRAPTSVVPIQTAERLTYPALVSYATVTETATVFKTATKIATVTSFGTKTITQVSTRSVVALPTLTAAARDDRYQDEQEYAISSEPGNSVLVWLEQLRISLREYLEDVWRTVKGIVA